MRIAYFIALGFWLGSTLAGLAPAQAQSTQNLVVVELYTSQGCSSCPPADELLTELAERSDVIPLALHVDYWDYLGWADEFASPNFTKRQKAYARAVGARTVYTPQMVVQGREHLVGLREMELADLIATYRAKPAPVALAISRTGGRLLIAAPAAALGRTVTVQLVRYTPQATVDIARGENRGRRITYTNIVTSWEMLGEWDGTSALKLDVKAEGNAPAVVIVQEAGPGAILTAARLR